jgi:hypothetical protein
LKALLGSHHPLDGWPSGVMPWEERPMIRIRVDQARHGLVGIERGLRGE